MSPEKLRGLLLCTVRCTLCTQRPVHSSEHFHVIFVAPAVPSNICSLFCPTVLQWIFAISLLRFASFFTPCKPLTSSFFACETRPFTARFHRKLRRIFHSTIAFDVFMPIFFTVNRVIAPLKGPSHQIRFA